jgi:histidine triad (HIT) family protein
MSEGLVAGSGCTFCALLAGDGPVSVVTEAELVVAFMDAFPVAPGHVLVVPRRHVRSLRQLTTAEGIALWTTAQRVAARVLDRYAPAVNLHLADGAEADQDVPHVHVHVVPRHGDDRVVIELPGERASRGDLDRVAADLTG